MLNVQPDSLLLAGDVALVLSVSAQAVREWEKSGKLTGCHMLRGVRLLRGTDVLELQSARTRERRKAAQQ